MVDAGVSSSSLFFFFFRQKTAYEMRISDWSSDVCSSDLSCRLSCDLFFHLFRRLRSGITWCALRRRWTLGWGSFLDLRLDLHGRTAALVKSGSERPTFPSSSSHATISPCC